MGSLWKNDDELFAAARRELFTAVVGDVMDKLGLLKQFLPPYVQPIERSMVAVGRAMPVLVADYFNENWPGTHNPVSNMSFGLLMDALDDLKPNEIYLCTGGSPNYSLWGELMATRARVCGAVGAVLDGYTRDTRAVLEMAFPTFARGCYAQDQGPRGKVIDFRLPVEVGAVRVEPGDIVFADIDGACVVPRKAEEEVFRLALEKARKEKTARKRLEEGMTSKAVFEEYGIL